MMVGRIAASLLLGLVCAVGLGEGTALACQTAGWTDENLAELPKMIVEADVTRDFAGPGWELHVRRALRGATDGETLNIGTQLRSPNDCFGQPPLEVGDHIVIALQRPNTATVEELAVWWVEPDGQTIERSTGQFTIDGPLTLDDLWAQLQALPDTATDAPAGPIQPIGPAWPLLAVFALSLFHAWRRFRVPTEVQLFTSE